MSTMRTRGQKLKQKQLGLPSSPPLQLATPPRRPRIIKKAPAPVQQSDKPTPGKSSETFSNFKHLVPSPQTLQPTAPAVSLTAKDSKSALNGSPGLPTVFKISSPAVDAAALPAELPHARAPTVAPAIPHTILHFWLDATPEDLASARPSSDPSIAMALPSSLIPDLLQSVARPANSSRGYTLTLNASLVGISPQMPSSNKRKLDDDEEPSQAAQEVRVEIAHTPKRQKRKGMFSRKPLQDLDTSTQTTSREPTGSTATFTRSSLYSKDGTLQLGRVTTSPNTTPLESEINGTEPAVDDTDYGDSDGIIQAAEESSTATPTPTENQPTEETPRVGRWGLGELLKSARSVSKFLPGFTPRAVPAAPPVAESVATDSSSVPQTTLPAVVHPATNSDGRSSSSATQSLQPGSPQPNESQALPASTNPHERVKDQHKKSSKKDSHSKAENQGKQKRVERRPTEAHRTESPAPLGPNRMGATPGTKRKRTTSPDTIPNPGGSSYGMDMEYFVEVGGSSSDEGEEMNSPTKARSSKHRRVHGPNHSQNMVRADTGKAQPYTGGFFASQPANYEGGNIFNEISAFETAKSQAKQLMKRKTVTQTQESLPPTPVITNLTGSFRVPSPSDSDSDPEDAPSGSAEESASPTELTINGQAATRSIGASPRKATSLPTIIETSPQTESSLHNGNHSAKPAPPSTKATSPPSTAATTWTQPPPPRPIPSHAALPSVPPGDSEALARARKRALQHQPHKPSGLRESSRISSPKILEDRDQAAAKGSTASAGHVNASGGNDTALTMRSENAGASTHEQPGALTNTANSEKPSEGGMLDVARKENNTSLTVPEPSPFIYVRDPQVEACLDAFWTEKETKQASDVFEGLYAAFLEQQ